MLLNAGYVCRIITLHIGHLSRSGSIESFVAGDFLSFTVLLKSLNTAIFPSGHSAFSSTAGKNVLQSCG